MSDDEHEGEERVSLPQVKEGRQQTEKLKSQLAREQAQSRELQARLEDTCKNRQQEVNELSTQLVDARARLNAHGKSR